ncbi:non-specific serine/threonine protein kinase [Kutzneria buriramensis]|uniref:Non-specific serine/threonine protein kinase n=1 Tax=Kutzneria buriramensis TaxID=1045776 RepID=A0A3E0H685_9PSEU|nr:non-specific serine/threonine protein kinase [Kutzneria buriramensis]
MAGVGSGRVTGNLPSDVTTFVGRRRESTMAKRVLRRTRLLTLTGMAGVGKTRLAVRVATQLRDAFPDGVWLVELAAVSDDTLLAESLADVLGVRDLQGHRCCAMAMLSDYLADKKLLLLLDNCEHLLASCAALTSRLLTAARGLRILATSRQPLSVTGEHLLEVPPMSVPELDPGQPLSPRAIDRHEAVRLFAERAATARPGFVVDATNRDTVARICRRLDGIPLAIELAALRVRALPVGQILAGLDDYLEFLAKGSRVAVPQLQTLRAAIDWSYALCSPLEQQLWARASVFAGGFDLDAAEAVCSGDPIVREDVFELVAALVDKSILTRADYDAPARYRMLEAIRQHGREQLVASSQQAVLRARHRDHYHHLAIRAERAWLGPHEVAWFARLRHEHPNLRAALEFCLTERDQARLGLEITAALLHYWVRSCCLEEGRRWLRRALELDRQPSRQRAKALWVSGWLTLQHADMTTALSLLKQADVLARQLGDEPALAYTTLCLGTAAFFQSDLHRAVALLEDALAHHHALAHPAGAWLALGYLALTTAVLGQPDISVGFSRERLALCDSRGASASRIYPLWGLGLGEWLSGGRQLAGRLIRETIETARDFGDEWAVAHCLETLAWIAGTDGLHMRAARLLGAAHAVWRSTGTPPSGPRYLTSWHDQCEQRARITLGDKQFGAAFRQGTRFGIDHAVDYALVEPVGTTTTVAHAVIPYHRPALLTRRERQVAELRSKGLSTEDIAATLLIAPHAAEGHLHRILIKLGLTDRAQLAAWITEHLPPSDDQ